MTSGSPRSESSCTTRPTPTTLQVPGRLTLLLRRQALSDYAVACEAAGVVAEQCGAAESPSPDAFAQLRTCRANVIAAEEALSLFPDDVVTHEAWDVSLDARQRDLIARLVRAALDQVCGTLESPEKDVLAAADRIGGLRALLDGLESQRT